MFDGYAVNRPGSSFKIGETIYSVIQLDFSGVVEAAVALDTREEVKKAVVSTTKEFTEYLIEQAMVQHGIKIEPTFNYNPGDALGRWLRELKKKEGRKIVLLIDECDDPVAQFLPKHPEFAESMVAVMRPVYLAIKKAGPYFHKVFITGVSKYSSTSLFSGANMLNLIMEDTADFSKLYGFTEQEIRDTYGPFIENKFKNQSLDEVMDGMRRMYDGFRVHPKQLEKDKLFNPWDVLEYLDTGELRSFWTDSFCTSSRVLEMLGMHGLNILDGFEIEMDDLFAPIAAKESQKHWQQLAFQTGYATIKNAVPLPDDRFTLTMGVPNQEIREFLRKAFVRYLVGQVGEILDESYKRSLLQLKFTEMESILEKIIKKLSPKDLPNEKTFQIYLLNAFIDDKRFQSVTAEPGARLVGDKLVGDFPRADTAMVAFNKSGAPGGQLQLVVFEMKYNQSAAAALQQMEEKKYAERVKKFYKENYGILGEVTVHMLGVNMNEDLTVELKHKVWSPQK
jgi:hypothetical protein